tara:strand:- start:113 stop:406 length:294 start_codon:yes stop_codon:yes gene_type:complete
MINMWEDILKIKTHLGRGSGGMTQEELDEAKLRLKERERKEKRKKPRTLAQDMALLEAQMNARIKHTDMPPEKIKEAYLKGVEAAKERDRKRKEKKD